MKNNNEPRYVKDELAVGLILRMWRKHRSDNPSSQIVLNYAIAELAQLKQSDPQYENVRLPKLRAAQKILATARKAFEELDKEIKKYIEETSKPWSLASLRDYPIPREALPIIFRVSRYSRIGEKPFTILHAMWAARLSTEITDIRLLQHWSNVYANREVACLMMNWPVYTYDIDSIWSMGPWELATAYIVNEARELELGYYYFQDKEITGYAPMYTSSALIEVDMLLMHEATQNQEIDFIKGDGDSLSVEKPAYIDSLELSYEAERVYTMWLRYLFKGPNTLNLAQQERLEILLELRDWVSSHELTSDSSILSEPLPWPLYMIIDNALSFNLIPTELLKKVGYKHKWLIKEG